MKEAQTWRELLGQLIHNPQDRHHIAETLGVNPITLIRWTTGQSTPRPDNLRPLLDKVPPYCEQFQKLIRQEFPHLAIQQTSVQEVPQIIPPEVYAQVLNAYATSPCQLRTEAVRSHILQHLVEQLDPHQQGLAATLMQFVPPGESNKLHSLRKTAGKGTGPYQADHEHWRLLFGAESQIGNAICHSYPVIMQTREEKQHAFPAPLPEWEESSAALPILFGDNCAGCLYMSSIQPRYFTPTRLDLLRKYTELLVLAFEPAEYYPIHQIELWVMPSRKAQHTTLTHFHQRVRHYLIQATQCQCYMTPPQAELQVWQEIETELHQQTGLTA